MGGTGTIPELPHGQKMTEPEQFDETRVVGVYGQSKAIANQCVLDAVREQGLNACIVMPSGILGPRDYAIGSVTKGMLIQLHGETPNGVAGTFNLCDVHNLANGLFLAAEKGKAGENYILANEVVSYPEFAALSAQEVNCKKPLIYLPRLLATIVAKILEMLERKERHRN